MTDKEAFERLKQNPWFRGSIMFGNVIWSILEILGIGIIIGMTVLTCCMMTGIVENTLGLWMCAIVCSFVGFGMTLMAAILQRRDNDYLYNPNSFDHGIVTSMQESRKHNIISKCGYTVYYTVVTDDTLFVTSRGFYTSGDRIKEGDSVYIANYGDSKYSEDTLIYKL